MITKNFLPVLHASSHLKKAIPEQPVVAFKRPKNLRDLLVHAKLKPTQLSPAQGTTACGSSRCLTCQHVKKDTSIRSTSTGQSFRVRATATCKTEHVIYLIECNLCNKQYVGETKNPLHIRLNGHRHDIQHKKREKPVGAHFSGTGHSLKKLKILVLEEMRNKDDLLRKYRESFWIKELNTLHPPGLNLEP